MWSSSLALTGHLGKCRCRPLLAERAWHVCQSLASVYVLAFPLSNRLHLSHFGCVSSDSKLVSLRAHSKRLLNLAFSSFVFAGLRSAPRNSARWTACCEGGLHGIAARQRHRRRHTERNALMHGHSRFNATCDSLDMLTFPPQPGSGPKPPR